MIHLEEKFSYRNASGDIVTFETNTENPLMALEVDVQCQQDLHGYANPWMGGEGKNVINADGFVGNRCTKNSDGSYTLEFYTTSVANRSTAYCPLNIAPGSYVLSATCSKLLEGNYISVRFIVDGSAQSGSTFYSAQSAQVGGRISKAITVPAYNSSLAIQLYFASFTGAQTGDSLTFSDVMLEAGETLTDYEPYSNICPISGFTGCNVTVSPTMDSQDGTTYAISWQTEAGSVYGGTLNVKTGVLTVDTFYRAFDGSEYWILGAGANDDVTRNFIRTAHLGIEPTTRYPRYNSSKRTELKSSMFRYDGVTSSTYNHSAYIYYSGSNTYPFIQFRDNNCKNFTTNADVQAYVQALYQAGTPLDICYAIETPITYQLTPTEVRTLLGTNHIWSNTGGINSCEYPVSHGEPYQDYFNAIKNGNRQHIRVTFILDKIVFEDEDITGNCQITTFMNPDIDLTFGTAFSSEINLSFIESDRTKQMNWAREFKVELGVENWEDIDWTQIGIFSGKRPLRNNNGIINLVAYDRMQRFDRDVNDFLSLVTFPCTLQQLFDALCSFVLVDSIAGDEIQTVMGRSVASDFNREWIGTCRDLLFRIAEANGCYARFTPDGYLQLKWFENHTEDFLLIRDNIFSFESTNLQQFDGKRWRDLADFTWAELQAFKWGELKAKATPFSISHILAKWAEHGNVPRKEILQPVTDPDIGSTYIIDENPFINYGTEADIRSHLQLILDRVEPFNMYYVASVNAVGNWIVEAGDVVSLELNEDEIVTYPIFSRTLDFNGRCECDYESTGNITRGEN